MSGLRFPHPMLLFVATAFFCVSCGLEIPGLQSSDKDKGDSAQAGLDEQAPPTGKACTDEARMACAEVEPGVYKQVGVGRQGPDCAFETLANEVDAGKCGDGAKPSTDMACTDEAKVVCVEALPGQYERRGVGRAGPDCAFATLGNEVADEKCAQTLP